MSMVIQTRLISSQYFFTRENVLFVRCRRDVPHSTPHRVYNFSCHMFISTSHCRAKRHNLDMGAARLRKYIRNANPSNISSLSLKSPPFSPDPCSLVSLFHLLSRHTRTAPRRPSLASHTPVDSPGNQEMKKVKLSSPDQEMKRVKLSAPTLKSCAAMELAGELGLGSLSRDWMLVRMAETS